MTRFVVSLGKQCCTFGPGMSQHDVPKYTSELMQLWGEGGVCTMLTLQKLNLLRTANNAEKQYISDSYLLVNPDRPEYCRATYTDSHPERGRHCQKQGHSIALLTWPGIRNGDTLRRNPEHQTEPVPSRLQRTRRADLGAAFIFISESLTV